jgi:hypothetical protein
MFKMMIVGLLPWGSSGHHKSKTPVNNHQQEIGRRKKCGAEP